MTDRVQRELVLAVPPEDVWDAVTSAGWLADEVHFDLQPGGDASFRSGDEVKTGWVEEAQRAERLTFWWAQDGEPASRVELTLLPVQDTTLLRVVESRPLELLDLIGTPLPGIGGARFGPALVAA